MEDLLKRIEEERAGFSKGKKRLVLLKTGIQGKRAFVLQRPERSRIIRAHPGTDLPDGTGQNADDILLMADIPFREHKAGQQQVLPAGRAENGCLMMGVERPFEQGFFHNGGHCLTS